VIAMAVGQAQPEMAEAPTAITDAQEDVLTSLHRTPLCGDVNGFRKSSAPGRALAHRAGQSDA